MIKTSTFSHGFDLFWSVYYVVHSTEYIVHSTPHHIKYICQGKTVKQRNSSFFYLKTMLFCFIFNTIYNYLKTQRKKNDLLINFLKNKQGYRFFVFLKCTTYYVLCTMYYIVQGGEDGQNYQFSA